MKDAAQPAELVIRMPSSYVYLDGELRCRAEVARGGRIRLFFSQNHGRDWQPVGEITASGEHRIDLGARVLRRYDYQLKLVLEGAGTGLDSLHLAHTVQHSQRALPALAEGKNRVRFSTGPAEGTVTLEASLDPAVKGKQLVYTDFHPEVVGVRTGPLCLTAGTGSLTFPVNTPGEMTRLRFGAHYRARDAQDGWDLQVSFDGGKSFKSVGRCAGPAPGNSHYVSFDAVPPGTRSALVRYAGSQRNTTCLFDFRIDADYREPQGGFRPVKITYVWSEGGVEKRDVHIARSPLETYEIRCASRPTMRSLIVEPAL